MVNSMEKGYSLVPKEYNDKGFGLKGKGLDGYKHKRIVKISIINLIYLIHLNL